MEDVHELPPFQRAAAVLQSRPWRRKRSRCLGCYIAGRSQTGKKTRNSKSGLYYWPFSRPLQTSWHVYGDERQTTLPSCVHPTKGPEDFSPSMAPSLLLQRGAGCSPAPVAAAAANAAPGHSKVFPGCRWNRLVESMPGKCPTWHVQHMKPNTSSGETNEPRETSNLLAFQVKFTHALLEIGVWRYLLLEASCCPI